jgi:tetratricopeptide (TPR) repeat protein
VCGWFFARNYSNFGHLLPPDQAGFSYWQDPGYATVGQFLRFGRSLSEPFLASFAGVPDGFYSTLWGDGGWGGVTSRAGRPPWNYELMAAGYLLALVPTALILTGGLALVRQAACRWLPQKLLLLAALAASFGGMLLFYLQHPMHGTIKAFYGLPSVAAICIFAAEGYRVLSRDIFWRQLVLASSLGAWGLTALASFVVDHSSPETQAWIARQQAVDGNVDAALALIASLTRENPADADLHLTAGQLLQFAKRPQEAQQEVAAAVRLDPNNADAQLLLAQTLGSLHKQDDELPLLQNVLRLAPDSRLAYKELALLHLARGDDVAAAETARAGLRVSPDEMRLHLVIAQASARLGRTDEAIEHYKTVLEWEPNQATALAGLASLEPSQSDQDLRDPALAGARRPAETEQAPAAREKRE